MSTTLTNGLKLPDKGSVDWYADMQSNYAILDGAVGTIAEHSNQISGKAPLVHTHTKSDITDFPAYGTTAGTICEGNDSRLSDARTPLSHTHTKSDVTDLFNSANTWSGQNTFSNHLYIYGQWKGLYFENPEVTAGVAPGGDKRNYIAFLDSNGYILGNIILNVIDANSTWFQIGVSAKDVNDSSQSIYCGTQYRVYGNGEKYFNPSTNGDVHLGTSTLKWKTLNGTNPGALSLPTTDTTKWVDLSGNLTAASSANTYTPAVDGWISVMLKRTGDAIAVFLMQGNIKASCFSNTALVGESAFAASACIPVRAGISVAIHLKGSGATIDSAYFIPCQGNV